MERKSRVVIIPNILFHQIWDICIKIDNSHFKNINDFNITEYIRYNYNINYKKSKLDYVQFTYLCEQTFKISRFSFKELLKLINKGKASISHEFCIPIRTVEDWYAEKNKCPEYIKLMILKQYHQLSFGKYMKLESEVNYFKTVPPVYSERTKTTIRKESCKDQSPYNLEAISFEPQKEYNKIAAGITQYTKQEDDNNYPVIERTKNERDFFEKYGFWPPQTTNDQSEYVKHLLKKTSYLDKSW